MIYFCTPKENQPRPLKKIGDFEKSILLIFYHLKRAFIHLIVGGRGVGVESSAHLCIGLSRPQPYLVQLVTHGRYLTSEHLQGCASTPLGSLEELLLCKRLEYTPQAIIFADSPIQALVW